MDNLKTFEEFDWKFGFGKKEEPKQYDWNRIPNPPTIYDDQELFDKVTKKITDTFDPTKVSKGYVAYGNYGFIYDLGKLIVKIYATGRQVGVVGLIKKENYVESDTTDVETLDANPTSVYGLYKFIERKLTEYEFEQTRARKQEYHTLIERRKNK